MRMGTMQEFNADYRDFPTFIYGITREIWEDRGVGAKLKRYYADNVLVRAPTGILTDNTGVTAATLQTLQEFPDRELVGEDVIWVGDHAEGHLSSHRLISVMRHTGDGAYGKATRRLVRSRIIADCYVKNDQVVEEWLARDQAALARCLGLSAEEMARRMAESDLETRGAVQFFTPETDVAGSYSRPLDESPEALFYADGWRRIWGDKEPAAIRDLYFHGASVEVPGGDITRGHTDFDRFCLTYLSAFPRAAFTIEHLIANRDQGYPARLAMRWSLRGRHEGYGRFGRPSDADVYIMGFSHAYLMGGRVTHEWIVTDEVSVWKQIIAHQRGTTRAA